MITRKCAIQSENWVPWTQPVMTADVGVGGSSFGATASSQYGAASSPFHAFNNNEADAWTTATGNRVGAWLLFFNPSPIKISSLNVMNIITTGRVITGGKIQGSTDGVTWSTLCTFTNSNTSSKGAWTITVNSSTAYSYHRIYVTATNSSNNIGLLEVDIVATYKA